MAASKFDWTRGEHMPEKPAATSESTEITHTDVASGLVAFDQIGERFSTFTELADPRCGGSTAETVGGDRGA